MPNRKASIMLGKQRTLPAISVAYADGDSELQPFLFFRAHFQRAFAALRADSWRSLCVILEARFLPPLLPAARKNFFASGGSSSVMYRWSVRRRG